MIFVGTYTKPILFGTGEIMQGKGTGIHTLKFNPETGALCHGKVIQKADNPSFLAVNHEKNTLYAVNELKAFEEEQSGAVSAFQIKNEEGELEFLNQKTANGQDSCHVAVDSDDKHIVISNFLTGSVCVYSVSEDGSLNTCTDVVLHEGSSILEKRQKGPHAHSAVKTPDDRYWLIPDLGIDKMMVYELTAEGKLISAPTPFFKCEPGSGPRFCEFHPNGKIVYLINELASEISVLTYDAACGKFELQQTISTVKRMVSADENICADVHVTPDGEFLYGSNRGDDSIAVFSIKADTGELELVEVVSCGGKTPRNFTLDAEGNYLLAANQDSDNVVVFAIDKETGKLAKESELELPTPVCLCWY